jgi:hypothetical protein
MTATPIELLDRALDEIFNQRDAAARRAVIDELFAPDIVFADPEGEATGLDAVAAQITALVDGGDPGFRFTSRSPAREAGDLGFHQWSLGPVGADPVVIGTDIVFVQDGRIARFSVVVG